MEKISVVPEGKIRDYVDGKFRNDTAEEYVRQTIERRLVDEHRYPTNQIAVEFTLQNGSKRPRADIVVFEKNSECVQSAVKIIVECKQQKISPAAAKDGIAQLQSYMSLCANCEWGMWTNGIKRFVFRKIFDNATKNFLFEEYNDIPSAESNIAEIDRPTRANLKNAVDDNLLFVFRTCHDYIYGNDGLHKDKAFFEFLKIIFCKIEDEKNVPHKLEFYATSLERKNPDGQLAVKNRIEKIFSRVKLRYPQIFTDADSLDLTPRSLARVVSELQKYSLLNTNIDIKGKAYEEIVGANLRGDRGEFFTPRNVMKMVVDMVAPAFDEKILDSSCGTGGFPVIAMNYVMDALEKIFVDEFNTARADWNEDIRRQFQSQIADLAAKNFFGFDLNPDLVKAAKMNMVMNNDGSGNIWQANSLLPPHEWSDNFKRGLAKVFNTTPENFRNAASIALFDVIITNPPFGSKIPIDDEHILRQFDLAHIWTLDGDAWTMTDRLQASVPPEILFVERCTQFLKPGGRMGIVLPDSILGSPGIEYIRAWLIRNHKILASIDLHADTFQPHNGTQTSVLILQKKSPEEIFAEERNGIIDYEIFMAQVEKVGHDKRGNATFKRDDDGREILVDGEKIIDDETAEVARIYHAWKKKLHIDSHVKACAVKLSDVLARGGRLEASVFDADALNARQAVLHGKFPVVPLGDMISAAYYGGRLKRQYVSNQNKRATGFIGSSEMLDCYPKPVKFMIDSDSVDDLKVSESTVLVSRSGTVGNVTLVNKTLAKFLISEHAIRLECKKFPGYVYAYLKSTTGQVMIQSDVYGAVIQEIEPAHLEKIPIPDAPADLKQKIHALIVRSYELRDESNALIDAAEKILIDELNLPPLEDFQREKIFTVKLSELSGRLDASYHTPLVDRIIAHLKAHAAEVTTVADSRISRAVILPGRFKRVYVDAGHGRIFIGGKQIGELDPSNKKYLSLIHHADRISDELELRENMTLITCSGTIGKVALVPKHWDGWAASQHIIRVIPSSVDVAGYFSVFLSTDYGRELIRRNTYGAVVDEIDDKQVRAVPVPLLKNFAAQKKINELALSANEKRFEAYNLEQEALKIFDAEVLADA